MPVLNEEQFRALLDYVEARAAWAAACQVGQESRIDILMALREREDKLHALLCEN